MLLSKSDLRTWLSRSRRRLMLLRHRHERRALLLLLILLLLILLLSAPALFNGASILSFDAMRLPDNMLSDRARFITGQVLALDGGWSSTKFLADKVVNAVAVEDPA